jgi:hypothetical protein
MLGTPSTRYKLEADALVPANATDREPAQLLYGAKVPPETARLLATNTMRRLLETDALIIQLKPTSPTEITTVTETEPAQYKYTDGAKENPDDHHPIPLTIQP